MFIPTWAAYYAVGYVCFVVIRIDTDSQNDVSEEVGEMGLYRGGGEMGIHNTVHVG